MVGKTGRCGETGAHQYVRPRMKMAAPTSKFSATHLEKAGVLPHPEVSPSPHLSISASTRPVSLWLFSAPVDLGVFLGSALVSLVALWIGARAGVLNNRTPD